MTDEPTDLLIVGAGQAGAQTAISLRNHGFSGRILMVGEESLPPYERPPLSKEYLAGTKTAERLSLRPPAFWAERDVDIRTSTRITEVRDHGATAEDGRHFSFRTLVWAAGGHPRRLTCPGADLGGVHMLRTRADADRLLDDLGRARHALIIGGGYIGLEVAATLRGRGLPVTIVEVQPRLLARVAAPPVADFYLAQHRAHGVEVLLEAAVAELQGQERVEAVLLDDGRRLAADLVLVGIGLVPSIAPLGLDALEVDGHCRTTLPDIYAVGDCATHWNHYAGGARVRIESVQNAVDMAKAAADHIVNGDSAKPYSACPWFWSNQYDLRLQTAGHNGGHDETVVRGTPDSGRWSLLYLRGGAVAAIDCINNPKDYMQGKALVERGARIAPALLADVSVPLKEMEG